METLGDKNKPKTSQKQAFKFYCKFCHYGTSKKSNYNTHLITAKHNVVTNGYIKGQKKANYQSKIDFKDDTFICSCGKEYQHRQGLWRHQKICTYDTEEDTNTIISNQPTDKDLIMMLIKENSDFKTMMMEQQNLVLEIAKNGTHNTNTTNSHNKAFNLQFFLNETCKDAMNITDFIESIQLQLSDLEKVGEIGYVEGISNIIVKNLNALDVSQRPVHCTDKKRETIYIRDENKWEKDEELKKIRMMIKKVSTKNAKLIQTFRDKHPDYNKYHSKYSDQYNKLIIESLGGSGNNDMEKEDKIIRNITKNITVDK